MSVSAVVKDVKDLKDATAKRLVLFDIDGTLLSAGPPARTAFRTALEDVFGTCGDADGYAYEGRLDPLIVADLMRAAGVPDETIALRLGEALALYLDRLEAGLRERAPVLKPGVPRLLENPSGYRSSPKAKAVTRTMAAQLLKDAEVED